MSREDTWKCDGCQKTQYVKEIERDYGELCPFGWLALTYRMPGEEGTRHFHDVACLAAWALGRAAADA